MNDGAQPVAPSAIPITNDEVHTPEGKKPYVTPRELDDSEVPAVVDGFRKAFQNAKDAGFDGVEVHGANGYLIDEFLRDGSNKRSGPYGGSIENRARFLFEVLDASFEVWSDYQVSLRLSLLNSYNSMIDSDPVGLSAWLARRLNAYKLSYLHIMRGDFFQQQHGDVLTPVRDNFEGVLVGNMGYSRDEANEAIGKGAIDAVAFGTSFLANPDLPHRFRHNLALNAPNPKTFYTPGPEGYTDYPFA